MQFIKNLNDAVGKSFVGKFFQIEERGSTFSTELAGASATFLTMAYILAVNPRILADSGGSCVPNDDDGGIFGPTYEQCLEDIKRQYVTATAIGSMVACLLMGLVANLPIALAPGMGMNAYFTYSVVGWRGGGKVSYQAACTAVMIEGAIFFVLALTGLRYKIISLIPEPVRIATPAGIGAFLAHLGLQTAEGIGAVVGDVATAVTLGACPEEKRTFMVAYDDTCKDLGICVFSDNYTCDVKGGIMTSGTTWLGLLGMMIIAVAMAYKSRLSFIYGIGLVTIVSWFRGTAVTYFPYTDAGNARFDYFKKVVDVTGLDRIITPFTSDLANAGLALFTMLYVDFLDTSGTLLGIVNSMGIIEEDGNFPKSTQAYAVDALSTMFGSIFGLSPITSYIESGAGVEAGAKTGLTAVICAFYFFISIFFAPILASIPPWAIGGALILVGALMARSLTKLNFNKVSHAVSGFLTVMVMPLTYSIAYGLIAGIGSYIVMEGVFWILSFAGLQVPGDEKESDMHKLGQSLEKEGKAKDDEFEAEEVQKQAAGGDEEAADQVEKKDESEAESYNEFLNVVNPSPEQPKE
mmetsp:Transcript_30322/g.64364  ORF Transcript_30322/g.64364 Transcript_30322/m.64364 type:complete len:579 (+) Transcript_30322:78-1814(+)|eukprot:CAMPEP_0172562576 /NCGR_PEP_ID=MMETSP1067-20121228/97416_1 /TAXON_ID=265564 ORGANISM="Thalassiosira punctigera, Strain Tpunct2005C2" /NCGR_SAMPLE_ID=MMETSP1067 /ASSEMBLY_ACC=CAM_ASM_000444 /LENGTH=578 /DNA_ID=CAMNT_0013352815 /DNA_START=71 /DNA_END=1807 /DNA_ORIENTATION=-